jgi:hypothetical protein
MDSEHTRIRDVNVYIRRAESYEKKAHIQQDDADANWIAAGKILRKLKADLPQGTKWADYVHEHIKSSTGRPMSRERADELIRIAETRTTVAKLRKVKRDSVRKTRAKRNSALRSAGNTTTSVKDLRQIGKARGLTPKEQKIFESTGSLAEALGCSFDPEKDKEHEAMTESERLSGAFDWQSGEALRLAKDCALLRRGADPATSEQIAVIKEVIAAWRELLEKLEDQLREKEKVNGKAKEEYRSTTA